MARPETRPEYVADGVTQVFCTRYLTRDVSVTFQACDKPAGIFF